MLSIHEYDPVATDMDDDDGMPPLVDNPHPSMTFTFFTDMTPITALSTDPTVPFETVWETPVPAEPVETPESLEIHSTSQGGPERTSHSKKRDSSYIPRPPNAFILFRSSFIRSQQVPEKVEGNHSTLSKIIGKYWKTLPREEREVWEAKALVAQAEHRRRYPDWRFRPGANALAKLKVKDGPTINRRRNSHSGRKGRADPTVSKKSQDERCTIIADLLVEGKTGVDLEAAVRRWEHSNKGGTDPKARIEEMESHNGGDPGFPLTGSTQYRVIANEIQGTTAKAGPDADRIHNWHYSSPQARSQTPDAVDSRFKIPLTAMFKRSLSAPASHSLSGQQPSHVCQDPLGSVFANVVYDTVHPPPSGCDDSYSGGQYENAGGGMLGESIGDLSPLVLPSVLGDGVPARWNNPYNLLETSIGSPPTQDCPGLAYTLSSPIDQSFANHGQLNPRPLNERNGPPDNMQYFCSHSTMKDWADCVSAYAQMPIFINEFGGALAVYDWCPDNDLMYMSSSSSLHYLADDYDLNANVIRDQGAAHPSAEWHPVKS